MHRKTVEEMDRSELIGMVHVLQSEVQELTSPERIRLYQLGRLHDQTAPAPEAEPTLWQRLFLRRVAPVRPERTDVDLDFRHATLAPR
jgi:hypothetical protein